MFQLERQEKILQYINEKQAVRTRELSEMFHTSLVTIRADINDLANRGLIIKSHGGALSLVDRINSEIASSRKSVQDIEAKRLIGDIAASCICDNDVIILDAGTTTLEIAKRINKKGVTVITNDIKIGEIIADQGSATLFMTGGMLIPSVYTLTGDETNSFLSHIKADKLFLGCDAIDFDWGVSNRTIQEVSVKRAMIGASKEVIAVASSAKFNKQVFAYLCGLDDLDMLITDALEGSACEKLAQHNVRHVTAKTRDNGQPRGVAQNVTQPERS